jgi:HAD superfamily hydrolase (TIGR01549 family)
MTRGVQDLLTTLGRTETLFLDAGGVLVNPNWERVAEALRRRGIAIEAASLARAEPHAKRELDTPERVATSKDDSRGWLYFNLVLGRAGIPLSAATDDALAELREYHGRSNLWEGVPDEVRPALRRFREAGLRLVVVSNANGTLRAHLDRLGLTPLVDAAFDSHDEGVEKPDPRFFEIALERGGARRESTVHVGDLYQVDVMGARAAGLGAVLFDAADLYPEADCPRVRSLLDLAARIETGRL